MTKRFVVPTMVLAIGVATAALLSLPGTSADPPARPKIYGIAYVRFKAVDLEKSGAFYSEILGFKPGTDSCKGLAEPCFAMNPYQYVQLTQTGASQRGSFLEEVGFNVSDVAAMRALLLAQGFSPGAIKRGPNNLRYFETEDPEHNRIGFVELSGADSPSKGLRQISNRLFHAGWVVHDLATEKRFYSDLLGFRLYWYGGFKDADTDWYEMQVRDGDNWVEFMLNIPSTADHQELGVQNHFSLGVTDIKACLAKLRANGLQTNDAPEIGRDGKWSFDIYDPDGNRIEFMEFAPAQTPCCHPYSLPHPRP
jgi:catechol 2,3-dioxygenase-like lactoylglutathione lyase family enzyme